MSRRDILSDELTRGIVSGSIRFRPCVSIRMDRQGRPILEYAILTQEIEKREIGSTQRRAYDQLIRGCFLDGLARE